jgi:predicted deacylase
MFGEPTRTYNRPRRNHAMLRRMLLTIPAAFLVVTTVSLANPPLRVGSVTAPSGAKISGWLEVPSGVDEGTRLPVTVVNGSSDGPVLALVAGVHGYEYAAIIALQRLAPRLDARTLSGAVIIVHMANPPAFYGRRVYYGPDQKNLNRMYPGNAQGTISERIADVITREVIDHCTHLIDMHGGDGNESLRPYTYWMRGGDAKIDQASKELALAYGFDRIVIDDERPESPQKTLYTQNTAIARGKPAITSEAGGMGLTDEASVDAHVDGVFSVLHHLHMLPAAADRRVEHPLWIDNMSVLRSTKSGVWQPLVETQQQVAKGSLIGRVLDPFNNVLEEIRAPFGGQMLYVVATPPTSAGEPLGAVAHILPDDATLPPTP